MFLRCSYFLAKSEADVLINSVLIKRKACIIVSHNRFSRNLSVYIYTLFPLSPFLFSLSSDELLRAEVEAGTAEGAAIGAALEILENASTAEDAADSGRGSEGESQTEAELAAEAAEAAAWAAAELRRLLPAIVRREMVSAALVTGVQGFVLADWPKNLEEVNIFEKEVVYSKRTSFAIGACWCFFSSF